MANIERPFTGLTAEVKINNVLMGYMSGIDLTIEKSMIEVLQFGAKYADKVPAQRSWSATVDGTFAYAPGGSQAKLYDAFNNDELITVGLFLDANTYFQGDAYIGNLNISTAPDDKTSISCDLEGAGKIDLIANLTCKCTASSGVGGTINPGGSTKVALGGSITYTITPAPNFELVKLEDNGVTVTTQAVGNTYTITNVTADHVVVATFAGTSSANKLKLRSTIEYAETLTQTAYTPDTWNTLSTALTSAKAVDADTSVTQTAVDAEVLKLQTAIEGLTRGA